MSAEFKYRTIDPMTQQQALDAVPGVAILGFACDEGVKRNNGRIGASAGPVLLRSLLAPLSIQSPALLYDVGSVDCLGSDLESAHQQLKERVCALRGAGHFVIVLGGGHETAFGHFQGLNEPAIEIINFDAHFDLRERLEHVGSTSGTPFYDIAQLCKANGRPFSYHVYGIQPEKNQPILFERAEQYAVDYLKATDVAYLSDRIDRVIQLRKPIYLTLCLDVFSQAIAPGVSAPQPNGLMPHIIFPELVKLARSGLVCAFDIVEYAPNYDVEQITAKLAINCLLEMIEHGYSCLSEWTHSVSRA